MGLPDDRFLPQVRRRGQPELADRLKQRVPGLVGGIHHLHQAMVDQGRQAGEHVGLGGFATARPHPRGNIGPDGLGRLQGEATEEDGQDAEEGPHLRIEQIVAPGDRGAHRLEAGRLIPSAASEEGQVSVEPV